MGKCRSGRVSARVVTVVGAMVMLAETSCRQEPMTATVTPPQDRGAQAMSSAGRAQSAPAAAQLSPVERGRYLVAITGCNDCHTPFKMGPQGPQPDMSRMLSGHPEDLKLPPPPPPSGPWVWSGAGTNTAFAGPWGVSYAMNLTPDVNSPFYPWTPEMFVKAMRTGKHFGEARPIMPPMPWQALGAMTDDDLNAVYAYLRSIPPVKNEVPDWQPPAPGR